MNCCRDFGPPDLLMATFRALKPSPPVDQHRGRSRLCPGREQRVRPRLRYAFCVAREHDTGSNPNRGGIASMWLAVRNASHICSGRGRALEIVLRRERLRRRHRGTIRIRQPGTSDADWNVFVDASSRADRLLRPRGHRPAAKNSSTNVSLPSADRLSPPITSFETALLC